MGDERALPAIDVINDETTGVVHIIHSKADAEGAFPVIHLKKII